jgi:plasmid stability protein
MPRITVRDVPHSVHAVLKDRARRNHRSLNQEVVRILEEAADAKEADRRAAMERIKRRRENGPTIEDSPAELKEKTREGLS